MAEYIEREAVLNILASKNAPWDGYQKVSELPSADVAPVVHGEWLEREHVADIQIDEWQSCRCSVCKKYHTTPFLYYFNNYNYCPNCGTKMK